MVDMVVTAWSVQKATKVSWSDTVHVTLHVCLVMNKNAGE